MIFFCAHQVQKILNGPKFKKNENSNWLENPHVLKKTENSKTCGFHSQFEISIYPNCFVLSRRTPSYNRIIDHYTLQNIQYEYFRAFSVPRAVS